MNLVRSYYFIGKQQFKKTDKATHFGNFSLNKTSVQESKHAQCPFLLRKGAYLFFFFLVIICPVQPDKLATENSGQKHGSYTLTAIPYTAATD